MRDDRTVMFPGWLGVALVTLVGTLPGRSALATEPAVPASEVDADRPAPPAADPEASGTTPSSSDSEPARTEALAALAQAQQQQAAVMPLRALESLERAIGLDPSLTAAYLTRAQLLVNLLGDLDSMPADPRERAQWGRWAALAASDLEHYLAQSSFDAEVMAGIEQQRAALLEAARRARAPSPSEAPPEPLPEPAPSPTPRPSPSPGSRRAGVGLVFAGLATTALGSSVLAAGLRIQRDCRDGPCRPLWRTPPQTMAPGIVAALLGTGLVTTGALLVTRADRGPGPRRVGAAMLGVAGAALVTSVSLAVAGRRAMDRADVDDRLALGRAQGLANAGLAIGAAVPTLLSGGLTFALSSRRSR